MKRFYLVVLGGLLSVITSQGANTADDGYAGFASSRDYHWTYVDRFVVPSQRIFDLMGRELSEPIPGHPFIKEMQSLMEKT